MASAKSRRVYVTTGLSNDALTEIVAGLEEGDRVLLLKPEGMPSRKKTEIEPGPGGRHGR